MFIQHVDGLGDVAVGGCAGDVGVTAERLDPGAVPELALHENGLLTPGQLPGPDRGAATAPLGGRQSGQVAKQFPADDEHGTTGIKLSPGGRKGSVARPALSGLHARFRAHPDRQQACLEHPSRAIKADV